MRAQQLEQSLCVLGKVIVETLMDASGQKCNAFEEALNIGIRVCDTVQAEVRCFFRMGFGEGTTGFAEVAQFLFVVSAVYGLAIGSRTGAWQDGSVAEKWIVINRAVCSRGCVILKVLLLTTTLA